MNNPNVQEFAENCPEITDSEIYKLVLEGRANLWPRLCLSDDDHDWYEMVARNNHNNSNVQLEAKAKLKHPKTMTDEEIAQIGQESKKRGPTNYMNPPARINYYNKLGTIR